MNLPIFLRFLLPLILSVSMLAFFGCVEDPDIPVSGKFIDSRDKHEYTWVIIGSQTWMAENLAYLPGVSPPHIGADSLPFFYVFRFEGSSVAAAKSWDFFAPYGVFYNWTSAMNGALGPDSLQTFVQGICPDGWHLPSDEEWDLLVNYLGGEFTAGNRMKSTKGWNTFEKTSGNGDNSSGFNAIAAGGRQNSGVFYNLGFNALFWSSTSLDKSSAWYRYLGYYHSGVYRYFSNMGYGFSVRCVRN